MQMFRSPLSLIRVYGARFGVGIVLLVSGCESTNTTIPPVAKSRPDPANKATPAANMSKLGAWRDAERLAAQAPGRAPQMGRGSSMQPVYGENSILVITKVDFGVLRAGMTVAYINSRGFQVVHQLLEPRLGGWRVQGINNEVADRDLVTRENLLGVVYASLAYGIDEM